MKAFRIFRFAGFALLGLCFITLAIFVTMLLWNSLIPILFHGPVLTFWQMAGLFILSKILLSGIGPHTRRYNHPEWRRRYHEKFRNRFKEEENQMNTEKA
jgi:hypothetical protein